MRFHAKPLTSLLLIPLLVLGGIVIVVFSLPRYFQSYLIEQGQLTPAFSPYWQESSQAIQQSIAPIERKFSYYRVQNWENETSVAERFGIALDALRALNPDPIIPGTTIKIPAITSPLSSLPPNFSSVEVRSENNRITVQNSGPSLQVLTLPTLATLLQDKTLLQETAPKQWRLLRSLILNKGVRLQLTNETVEQLDLASTRENLVCLCAEGGQVLLDHVIVEAWDQSTNQVDSNYHDKRSFIRASKSSRMDLLNSELRFLGYDSNDDSEVGGGTYGVSWRVSSSQTGINSITGWIENSKFHDNYFGAYTFGASGMVWRNNEFYHNLNYGLDLHDKSSNFLIEHNTFHDNNSHGLILSKDCQNTLIRDNKVYANKGNGIMLHESSNHNLVETNTLSANQDNIVVYKASYNVIQANVLSNPTDNNIRLNQHATYNDIARNTLTGGQGIKIYEMSDSNLLQSNTIATNERAIMIDQRSPRNVMHDNSIRGKGKVVLKNSRIVIAGPVRYEP